MIQHITLEEVKAACRLAYAEDRLLAQADGPIEYGYRTGNRVCAIGAALTKKTLDYIEKVALDSEVIPFGGTEVLYTANIADAFSWDKEDQNALHSIQNAHDKWLQASLAYGDGNDDIEELFCKLVGITGGAKRTGTASR